MCAYVHVSLLVNGGQRLIQVVFFLVAFHLCFFETVSFIEPKSQQFSYVSWSVDSRDSPVSSNSPVVTDTWCHIQILSGC